MKKNGVVIIESDNDEERNKFKTAIESEASNEVEEISAPKQINQALPSSVPSINSILFM